MSTPKQEQEITDRSYGIIPLRYLPYPSSTLATSSSSSSQNPKPTTKNTQLLLIHQKTLLGPGTEFWCFPKGHPEDKDKDVIETAMRELFEETGLVVSRGDIVPLTENGKEITLRERYTNPIRKQGKEVVYFVAVVRGEQEVRLQEKEVESARWVGWEEGRGLITFEECREMLGIVAKALDATIGGEGEEGKEEGGVKAKV